MELCLFFGYFRYLLIKPSRVIDIAPVYYENYNRWACNKNSSVKCYHGNNNARRTKTHPYEVYNGFKCQDQYFSVVVVRSCSVV